MATLRASSAPSGEEVATSPATPGKEKVHPTLLGLSHVLRPPKWSILGRHDTLKQADVPGPGYYPARLTDFVSRFQSSPGHSFGVAGRDAVSKPKVPGPGAYSLSTTMGKGGRAYSLTPRRGEKNSWVGEVPGPGAHEIRSTVGRGVGCKLPQRLDEQKDTAREEGKEKEKEIPPPGPKSPGPGEYDRVRADQVIHGKSPRWGFGTSKRLEGVGSGHMATPGPGAYMVSTAVGMGPKFSMQARHPGPRLPPSPGPGAHGGHYSSFT